MGTNLQRRGPPPGRAGNTTATLEEPLHPERRPAALAMNLWLVGRRQEGGCGGWFFPYNGVRPHLPGSCQGWGDGWPVLITSAMPAVAKQLAPNKLALEESIPAFSPAVKQAQPGRTFWPVARQTPNPCRLETGGTSTRHSANTFAARGVPPGNPLGGLGCNLSAEPTGCRSVAAIIIAECL
jgi:hypothetical protein